MTNEMTNNPLTKKPIKGITEDIRSFFRQFPNSSPKEVCRILYTRHKKLCENRGIGKKQFYDKYKNMVRVEKHELRKWMKTNVKGRLPTPLVSAHRVEWSIEQPLSIVALLQLNAEAEKRRPGKDDVKPDGFWYVIPNRNRMREYHDKHGTVRIFPKSGTVRILPGHEMAWPELKVYVEKAFFLGRVPFEECERLAEQLVPCDRHKTFRIGPVSPFKVDHYIGSLGLTLSADGSHPEHLEACENWPSWIKPLLAGVSLQAEVNKELAKQIRLHLSVMGGIDNSAKKLELTAGTLYISVGNLAKILGKFNVLEKREAKNEAKERQEKAEEESWARAVSFSVDRASFDTAVKEDYRDRV